MKNLKQIGLVLLFGLIVSFAFSAQDPSVLLEKGIYAEETIGNLADAIGIYQQVIAAAEANRTTAATALFRLGMCYQKSGRAAEAQAAFAKLAKLYPEQKELISRIPAAPPQELGFGRAPWVDGEILRMNASTKGSGPGLGLNYVYTISSTQEEGKAAWKIRTWSGTVGISENHAIWMDSNYAPVLDRQTLQGLQKELRFFGDHIEASSSGGSETQTKQFPLTRAAFDEEQIYYLLRCLPFQDGYKTTLPFVTQKGTIYDLKISVVGQERLSVTAGIFECFKILIEAENGNSQICHISSDSHRYIVKASASSLYELELNSIGRMERNKATAFEDKNLGITLTIPPGWVASSSTMAGINLVNIVDPDGKTSCFLLATNPPTGTASLSDIVEYMIKAGMSQYKDYQVRPGRREDTTTSGIQVIRIIADHKGLIVGEDLVDYQFFFRSTNTSGYGYLMFQTGGNNFEKMRPVFDSIAYSLQIQ